MQQTLANYKISQKQSYNKTSPIKSILEDSAYIDNSFQMQLPHKLRNKSQMKLNKEQP